MEIYEPVARWHRQKNKIYNIRDNNMKNRNRLFSRLAVVLASAFLLSACGGEITKLTMEEATRIMEQETDYPKVRSINVPAKVHERDWPAAYNKSGFLRKLVAADLMTFTEATPQAPFFVLTPTEEGSKFLLNDGEIQSGGDFGRGFYIARQANENYVKVTKIAEMIRFKVPPPSIELQVTDVHFDISLSDLTPFGTAVGLKEGQPGEAKTGLLWKKTAWTYMKK